MKSIPNKSISNDISLTHTVLILPANKNGKRKKDDNNNSNTSKRKISKRKSFICTGYGNCSMAFTRAEHLARHIRKHTGEKPFQCKTCLKFFSRIDNLKQHRESVHARHTHSNSTSDSTSNSTSDSTSNGYGSVDPSDKQTSSITSSVSKPPTKRANIADLLNSTETTSTISLLPPEKENYNNNNDNNNEDNNNEDNNDKVIDIRTTHISKSIPGTNNTTTIKPDQGSLLNKLKERIYQQPLTTIESKDVIPGHIDNTPTPIVYVTSSSMQSHHHNNHVATHHGHGHVHSYLSQSPTNTTRYLDDISIYHQPVYPFKQQHQLSSVRQQQNVSAQTPQGRIIKSKANIIKKGPSIELAMKNSEGNLHGLNRHDDDANRNRYSQSMIYHYPPHYYQYQQQYHHQPPQSAQQVLPQNQIQYIPSNIATQQNKLYPVITTQNSSIAYIPLESSNATQIGTFNTNLLHQTTTKESQRSPNVQQHQLFMPQEPPPPPLPKAT